MDYILHISSTNNSFIGTGFMGTKISSMEDIKQAMHKYATFTKGNRFLFKFGDTLERQRFQKCINSKIR